MRNEQQSKQILTPGYPGISTYGKVSKGLLHLRKSVTFVQNTNAVQRTQSSASEAATMLKRQISQRQESARQRQHAHASRHRLVD